MRILRVGGLLQATLLWPPVEKLFLSDLGFTAATIGIMAATYTAVVPLLEVPSGVAADRGSRRLMLVLAAFASALSALMGWLSHGVGMYLIAAVFLGVFFAFSSGSIDSILYDALLEDTGTADGYERELGKIRMFETAGLVASALLGGLLAQTVSVRATYLVTVPLALAAAVVFARLDEPTLHRRERPAPLREQLAVTLATVTRQRHVRRFVLVAALVGMLSQVIYEFGPLWLVAAKADPALYGPYWAVLVSAVGVGGYLVGKLDLDARRVIAGVSIALVAPAVALATVDLNVVVIVASQFLMALALSMLGVHAGRLVHDGVDSSVRSGVSSSVGTLGALLFLPFSVGFGFATRGLGIEVSGWALVAVAAILSLLSLRPASGRSVEPALSGGREVHAYACRDLVLELTDFLSGQLGPDQYPTVEQHLKECPECRSYVTQMLVLLDRVSGSANAVIAADPQEPD